jgi:hypothetical protein
MHSRIYQISKTPINECDYIEESHFWDHWFTNEIADYVDGNVDRDDDIKWLKECYENNGLSFGTDDNGEYFIVEDKTKYFAQNFDAFQKFLKELSETTLDGFVNGECEMTMYRLKKSYNNIFGFYVECEDCGCETFDGFIRHATVGVKYYIGATIDYHC